MNLLAVFHSSIRKNRLSLVVCLLFWLTPLWALERPALMLAKKYHTGLPIAEYWVSEKLDGVRARWDGEQLISRGGRIFAAPQWFTVGFPAEVLDGELWWQRGQYEKIVSIVNRQQPHEGWRKIRFMLFDAPSELEPFSVRLEKIKQLVQQTNSDYLGMIRQTRFASDEALQQSVQAVVKQGGEGLMLHHQDGLYRHGRSTKLLKLKIFSDAEAVVIGYRAGKGKYQGKVGSLHLRRSDGVTFYAGSGLSDRQRDQPPLLGSVVTYRYQGLTRYGKPRFPVFLRQRKVRLESRCIDGEC